MSKTNNQKEIWHKKQIEKSHTKKKQKANASCPTSLVIRKTEIKT
jgi:hypothetical protein